MSSYDPKKFEKARALFPHAGKVIYFNTAAYGPFSAPVRDAVVENLDLRVTAEKDDTMYCAAITEELRKDFAWLVNAKPEDIGIGLNTSFGLNVAAFGLPLEPGDEILVSDVEFPAIIYTWKAAAKERGLTVTFVPSKNRVFDVDALKAKISPKSKVLCISSVQFFNGFKNDLHALSKICKEHGMYFVVDAIQGLGVEPTDVVKYGIDLLTSGCQKWLLSPQGCGFFYISPELRPKMRQPFFSWLGVDWNMNYADLFRFELDPYDSAERFEMGYYVVFNLLAMKQAMNIFRDLGIEAIQQHSYALIDRLAEGLRGISGIRITSSLEPKHRSSIFTFTCDKYEALHKALLAEKIIQVCREGSIRISVHLFSNESDIDTLIAAVKAFQAAH